MTKNHLTAVIAALLTGSTLGAAPFMAIGSSAELFVTAKAGIEINDNITLGSDYVVTGATAPSNPVRDDTVFTFAPGLSFEFGKNALVSGKFAYVETITRFGDASDLDSELSDVSFNGQHKDEKSKTTAKASFKQLNQNTVDARSPVLSRRDVFNLGLEHEMELTAKTSILFGFDHTDTNYASANFVDRTNTSVPLRAFYELTPKVDLSMGAQYREINADTSAGSSKNMFYSLGTRGEFTPKLSGFFRVGVVDRNAEVGPDRTSLGLSSDFTFKYSEKTQLTFGASNDFSTSGTGGSQENLDGYVGFNANIMPDFSLRSRFAIRRIDYFDKPTDTYFSGSVAGDYTVNEYLKFTGAVNYQNNSSGSAGGDFNNTVFSVMANIRY